MSKQIIETLVALPVFREKTHFFIYCSYQSEVETTRLFSRCLEEGKTVSVPLTVPEQLQLQAITITDPSVDLSPGYKGIPEPISSLTERRVNPQSIEVAIIPGAVFDRTGHRLGYGGGYYDRFLAQAAPQAIRIGLAYSQQVVSRIPGQPHDIPMDILVTDREVLSWPRYF